HTKSSVPAVTRRRPHTPVATRCARSRPAGTFPGSNSSVVRWRVRPSGSSPCCTAHVLSALPAMHLPESPSQQTIRCHTPFVGCGCMFERDGKGQGRGQPGGSGADQLSELVGVLCEAAGESLGALARLDVASMHADDLASAVLALEGMRRSLDAAVGHALGALHEVKGTRSSGLATS